MDIATDLIRAEPHAEIGTLLQRHAHTIVDRWCNVARDEQNAAKRVHHAVLRDQLPAFLEAVGRALKEHGAPDATHQRTANEHGEQRWDNGWSITELVRDYQLLRLTILEFLEEHLHRPLRYREAMAVGVFIDDAIAGSIARYVAHRDDAAKRSEHDRARTLADLSRRKDEFLAILGHELRNPLAPIRNSLMVLRKLVDNTNRTVATSLDVLDRQSQQLARLVDDLLDIARIGRGEFELRKSRFDLRRGVEQALQMTESLIKSRGHSLHVSMPDAPLEVDADPQRVCQVVTNLLNNAAKYTEPRGNIWLTVERQADSAVICVRDDGIGIAPEMLARVFELFERGDRSRASGREGLGIGLALVQRLVQQHGGTISARSAGAGKGTEFVVRLPTADAPDPASESLSTAAAADQLLTIKQVRVEKS